MKRSLRSWLWRVPIEDEVEDELAFHVEMRRRERPDRVVDPAAIDRVRRECVDLARKRDREMGLTRWMEEVVTDVRFALRQLRASPGFTLVAATTLALGIGANSAMFALADAALLRPLPFDDPDRVVMLWERRPDGLRLMAAPAEFADWNQAARSFEAMASVVTGSMSLAAADGTTEQIPRQTVSPRYFDVLRVAPIAGRTFIASDVTESPNAVVISEGFWRRRFGADPAIVGRDLVLDGQPHPVIGILPAAFQVVPPLDPGQIATGAPIGVWRVESESSLAVRPGARAHYIHVIGRLKRGVTIAAAAADVTRVADQLARDSPSTYGGHGIVLEPLRDALIGGEVRLTATVLLGVVGFVLLMCCANVANLLLARTGVRARELAVRSALGAGRRRIAGQLLTESLVLALLGGVFGVAVGAAILRVVPALIPPGLLPNAVAVAFDARVATFCALATLLVGLMFGLAPAWQATGASLVQVFASSGRTTRSGGRLRGLLVVGEVAAAVLVLSGAGLLLRTWMALDGVDPGARAHDLLTTTLALPFPRPGGASRYATPESARQYYDAVAREVAGQPGVKRVALGGVMPLDGGWISQSFEIAGDTPRPDGQKPLAPYHMVSPEYFEVLAIPIVSGRAFTEEDSGGGPPVAIVSEAFVQQHLAGRPPIGMRVAVTMLALGPSRVVEREIIGVARQVKAQPDEPLGQPHLYVPLAQNTWWSASLIVEPDSGQQAEALVSTVRAAVGRIDPDRTLAPMRTLEAIAWSATSRPRFRAVLVTAFAAVALTLALVGVFGVLAYSVQQRTREFGVRIALGASVADVLRLVFASAVRVTLTGVAVGLAAAAALSRYVATLLFEVEPIDPVTFAAVAGVLGLTALGAAAAPAVRGSRVDPVVTFRSE